MRDAAEAVVKIVLARTLACAVAWVLAEMSIAVPVLRFVTNEFTIWKELDVLVAVEVINAAVLFALTFVFWRSRFPAVWEIVLVIVVDAADAAPQRPARDRAGALPER